VAQLKLRPFKDVRLKRWRFSGGWRSLRLLHRLARVPARDRFVPPRVIRPCPGLAYGSARHRLNRARLAEGTEIDVEENSKQHDQGGKVVDDIRN
jgi:hypothetical protein